MKTYKNNNEDLDIEKLAEKLMNQYEQIKQYTIDRLARRKVHSEIIETFINETKDAMIEYIYDTEGYRGYDGKKTFINDNTHICKTGVGFSNWNFAYSLKEDVAGNKQVIKMNITPNNIGNLEQHWQMDYFSTGNLEPWRHEEAIVDVGDNCRPIKSIQCKISDLMTKGEYNTENLNEMIEKIGSMAIVKDYSGNIESFGSIQNFYEYSSINYESNYEYVNNESN